MSVRAKSGAPKEKILLNSSNEKQTNNRVRQYTYIQKLRLYVHTHEHKERTLPLKELCNRLVTQWTARGPCQRSEFTVSKSAAQTRRQGSKQLYNATQPRVVVNNMATKAARINISILTAVQRKCANVWKAWLVLINLLIKYHLASKELELFLGGWWRPKREKNFSFHYRFRMESYCVFLHDVWF